MRRYIRSNQFSGPRRRLLKTLACVPAMALPGLARANPDVRSLHFSHLHTGETLGVTYVENGVYLPDALTEINHLLRDFRTSEIVSIDTRLLDFVHMLQTEVASSGKVEIISGYRSPATNEQLRNSTSGVAKKSFHMKGQAVDIRITDKSTRALYDVAKNLGLGGVGYYPSSDFLHVDVGPVRSW